MINEFEFFFEQLNFINNSVTKLKTSTVRGIRSYKITSHKEEFQWHHYNDGKTLKIIHTIATKTTPRTIKKNRPQKLKQKQMHQISSHTLSYS
jgi:hypothetical protein